MYSMLRNKLQENLSDKNFSEILKGSVWALGAKVVATALGLVTSVIIARRYGADILGIVAVVQSFLLLATLFTLLGTKTSILRLIPEHLAKYSASSAFAVYRTILLLVVCTSLTAGAVLFFSSGFVARVVFSKEHLRFYFALASVFIVCNSLMLLTQEAVRGLRLIRAFALMQLLPQLAKLLILLPLTFLLFHQDNPVYALMGSYAVTAMIGLWIMHHVFNQRIQPSDPLHVVPVREVLAISLPMLMTATMTFIIGETGVLMLGMFRPEAEVGYYSIAVKLATLTSFVLTAINSMAAPKFSELYHSNKIDELFSIAKKSSKLIFWTTTPILLFFIFLGKPVLQTIFGEPFGAAYPALVLLILGQFVNSISGATGYFMNMTGHQNMFRNIVFVAALANILLNVLLTPRYGLHGAAIAAMVSIITWNVATLIYIKSKFGKTTGYFPLVTRKI
ncbi:MAG TPA: flippase [Desulfonatronum sp.]|nr:flippase [Desulfonatronum sp.]